VITFEVRTDSPEDTLALGRRLASLVRAADVVLLTGRLGTGKTLFTSGLAEGLGISGPVTSPSFIIARTYRDGFLPLTHADVYRLGSRAEFDDLELVDFAHDGVLVIEWGEAVAQAIPEDHLSVHIEMDGPDSRIFRFESSGSWDSRPLHEVAT
jgi:tRNA threonylcarbamoyl adenosine modification protein YjeE